MEIRSFIFFCILLGFLIWLFALISHLRRTDLNDTDKIVWTVVLCTLNFLGVILYFFLAPTGKYKVRTEEELKEYFNSRSRGE